METATSANSPRKIASGIIALALLFGLAALLIRLEKPTGSVEGRVLGPDGAPIAGANVSLDAYPYNYDLRTDAQGFFSSSQIGVREYYYSVHAKGFQAYYPQNRLIIEEGRRTVLEPISLKELDPAFYADLWDDTKMPDEKITLSMNGAKIKEVQFSIYKLNLLDFLKKGGSLDELRTEQFDVATLPADSKVKEWIEAIPPEQVPEFDRKVKVPIDGKGMFLIHAVASSPDRTAVFTRNMTVNKTDLGFVAKRDEEKILILASSFLTPKPQADVQITVFNGNETIGQAATGPDGIAQLSIGSANLDTSAAPVIVLQKGEDLAYLQGPTLYLDNGGEGEAEPAGEGGEGEEGAAATVSVSPKVFIYTERPLYRPGQKVFFKGIIRGENLNGGFQSLPPQPVQVTVSNPKGDVILEQTLTSNTFGSFWSSVDLEEEGGLGYYTITATVRGREFTRDFEVEEYRKPEFKVDIQPDKVRYFPSDKITFTIDTQYYFGAPLETDVEYTIYKSPYYYSGPEDEPYDSFQYGYEPIGGYGEFVEEGKVRTDANGKATVTIKAPKSPEDQRITLRATAKDLTERVVTKENDAYVVGGDFYFRTQSTDFLGKVGQPYKVTVLTRNYDDKPVARDFKVEVQREKWDPFTSNYKYQKKSSAEGKTDASGKGQATLNFEEGGYYRLVFSGKDDAGRKVVFNDYLWVSGKTDSDESFGLEKNMVVIPDKKKFQAGEKVRLFIVGPVKDGTVLVTVEGMKIQEHHLVQLDGFSKELEITLKKEWIPNVYISVAAIGKRQYYESQTDIAISPAENFLQVEVQPTAAKYQPGQDIVYKITTKDNTGQPVAAEVSLGVVDESLYALKEDSTNIKEFFWGPRENRVGTAFSFSGYYSGGLEKEDQRLLRKNFKDTAYWNPTIMTDPSGQAEVTFQLPDNLTTWRATAIAQTMDTQVGQQIQKVVSSKDLIVRLAIPRFFTERDRLFLKALVANYTDQDQVLQTTLDMKGLEFVNPKDGEARSLTVGPKKTVSFEAEVIAKTPGTATLQMLAKNAQLSDGFELKIPVLPYGTEDHQYQQGEVYPGGTPAEIAMNLPPQVNLPSAKISVTVDSSLFAQLLGPVSFLVDFPYGCVEQTTSRMLAALTVAELYKTLGISDPLLEKKIPRVVKKGITRLLNMQQGDGGWGWWKSDAADPFMTAYALYGLIRAQGVGQPVNADAIKRGKEALQKILKDGMPVLPQYNAKRSEENRYFIHYVASVAGVPNKPPIPQAKPVGTHMAQAYLILALEAQKRRADALPLTENLKRDLICSDGLCHLSDGEYGVGDAEVTAWGLRAFLHVAPEDKSTIDSLVKWLMQARRGGIWRQTRETAAAVYALSEFAESVPSTQAGVKVLLTLNGKELEKINVASPHFVRKVNQPALNTGGNAFQITNLATHNLYYQTDLSYYIQQDPLAPSAQGIKVSREYVRLKGERDLATSEVVYKASELKGAIAKGETIGVRLTVESDNPLTFVVLEDPLPAGFEVVNGIRFDKDAAYYTETEVHDEKIALFMTYIDKGKRIFNYGIRPEIPGTVNAMPTKASEMYAPEVRGSSGSLKLEVK